MVTTHNYGRAGYHHFGDSQVMEASLLDGEKQSRRSSCFKPLRGDKHPKPLLKEGMSVFKKNLLVVDNK